jgi:6-pyruvoyltetrahydropterin/6-carboxytetrahydropterin synthase
MMAAYTAVASGRFEAARQLGQQPKDHRCHGLHGHSFVASVIAHPAMDCASGTVIAEWKERIAKALAPLDYAHLNMMVGYPTDENLARWIAGQLQPAAAHRITIQSTPDQGTHVDLGGEVSLWRRYRFQAAHQLPNVPPGHKCGRMHGHGFQVVIQARKGADHTGSSLDYDAIDAAWAPLSEQLNYRCLNEIPGLANPTSELISSWIWQQMKPDMQALATVTVFETGACGASFDGANYRIWKEFTFDSAVCIKRAAPSRAESALHGHTFKLRLQIKAPLDEVMGWTLDFGDVKAIFKPIFQMLDHRPLHEMAELADSDTASIAAWIHGTTRLHLPQLERVELYETEGCGAIIATNVNDFTLPV